MNRTIYGRPITKYESDEDDPRDSMEEDYDYDTEGDESEVPTAEEYLASYNETIYYGFDDKDEYYEHCCEERDDMDLETVRNLTKEELWSWLQVPEDECRDIYQAGPEIEEVLELTYDEPKMWVEAHAVGEENEEKVPMAAKRMWGFGASHLDLTEEESELMEDAAPALFRLFNLDAGQDHPGEIVRSFAKAHIEEKGRACKVHLPVGPQGWTMIWPTHYVELVRCFWDPKSVLSRWKGVLWYDSLLARDKQRVKKWEQQMSMIPKVMYHRSGKFTFPLTENGPLYEIDLELYLKMLSAAMLSVPIGEVDNRLPVVSFLQTKNIPFVIDPNSPKDVWPVYAFTILVEVGLIPAPVARMCKTTFGYSVGSRKVLCPIKLDNQDLFKQGIVSDSDIIDAEMGEHYENTQVIRYRGLADYLYRRFAGKCRDFAALRVAICSNRGWTHEGELIRIFKYFYLSHYRMLYEDFLPGVKSDFYHLRLLDNTPPTPLFCYWKATATYKTTMQEGGPLTEFVIGAFFARREISAYTREFLEIPFPGSGYLGKCSVIERPYRRWRGYRTVKGRKKEIIVLNRVYHDYKDAHGQVFLRPKIVRNASLKIMLEKEKLEQAKQVT